MKNHCYNPFSQLIQKLNLSYVIYMMFIYNIANLAPVRTNILEIFEIFVRTVADHALFSTPTLQEVRVELLFYFPRNFGWCSLSLS